VTSNIRDPPFVLHSKAVFEKLVAAREGVKLVLLTAHHLNQRFEDVAPVSAFRRNDVVGGFCFSGIAHREIQRKAWVSDWVKNLNLEEATKFWIARELQVATVEFFVVRETRRQWFQKLECVCFSLSDFECKIKDGGPSYPLRPGPISILSLKGGWDKGRVNTSEYYYFF